MVSFAIHTHSNINFVYCDNLTNLTIIAQWIDRFHHKCSTSLLVIPHTHFEG